MRPNSLADTVDNVVYLFWNYGYSVEMENYYISILTEGNEFVVRETFSPRNYIGDREFWQMQPEIELESGQVYKWRIDTGARYAYEYETLGSESQWATFVYIGSD
jgi:hypothetical protein